ALPICTGWETEFQPGRGAHSPWPARGREFRATTQIKGGGDLAIGRGDDGCTVPAAIEDENLFRGSVVDYRIRFLASRYLCNRFERFQIEDRHRRSLSIAYASAAKFRNNR